MKSLRLYFYIILQTWTIVNCETGEIAGARGTVGFTENAEEETSFVDPHSFDYDRANKKMVDRRKFEYQRSEGKCIGDSQCRIELKECRDALDNIEFDRIYTMRLINLLLSTAKLQEDGDLLSGSITLSGQKADIEKLRVFGDGKITMREVDVILSNVITPTVSVFTETITWIDCLCMNLYQYRGISAAVFATLLVLLSIKYVNWSAGKVVIVFLASVFLLSYFMIYSQLIKEAEIKRLTDLMKQKEPPIQCEPEKMSFWDRIVTHFEGRDQCFDYYKTIEFDAFHEVTPLDALSEVFDRLILQQVARFGSAISGFIENSTKNLSWPMNWIVTIMSYLILIPFMILLPFLMLGGKLRFWFGPFAGMSIGGGGNNQNPAPAVPSENQREPIIYLSPVILERNSNGELRQLASSTLADSKDNNLLAVGDSDSKTHRQVVKQEDTGTVCRSCCCKDNLNKSHIVEDEDRENKATKSDVRKEDKGDGDC